MGLDAYAYVAGRKGQYDEYYETGEWDANAQDIVNPSVTKPREIAYWRKHHDLQTWMRELWLLRDYITSDDRVAMFNGIELELTWDDVDRLEKDIQSIHENYLYRKQDLEFCSAAKAELFLGARVFYNSSW